MDLEKFSDANLILFCITNPTIVYSSLCLNRKVLFRIVNKKNSENVFEQFPNCTVNCVLN